MNTDIIQTYIPAIQYDDMTIQKTYSFSSPNRKNVFLLSSQGTSIILEKDLYDTLIAGEANKSLKNKLQRKGFTSSVVRSDPRASLPIPRFFMIDVTTRCNMKCFYCLRHFPDEGANISDKELDNILNYISAYCRNHNIKNISLQPWGGEPLLAFNQIIRIQEVLQSNGLSPHISVQTNGLLLSKPIVNALHHRNISIGVSIDGCQTIHDLHRPNWGQTSTFLNVVEGIRNVQEYYGEDFGTITVISKKSIQYMDETLDFFAKELRLRSIKMNLMHPNSDAFDMRLCLEDQDINLFIDKLLSKLLDLYQEGYSLFESNIRDKLVNILCGNCGEICHSNGCTGGYAFLTFARNGDIYPCELVGVPQVRLGSIYEKSDLVELIKHNLLMNPYFIEKSSKDCDACPWKVFCLGGCTASCISYGQPFGSIDKKECAVNRVLYPKLIEIILSKPEYVSKLTNGAITIIGD